MRRRYCIDTIYYVTKITNFNNPRVSHPIFYRPVLTPFPRFFDEVLERLVVRLETPNILFSILI